MMGWQFEIYQTSVKGFRWKLRDDKGILICMSDKSYPDFETAEADTLKIRLEVVSAKIIDMDSEAEVKKRSVGTATRKTKKVDKKPAKKSRKITPKKDKKSIAEKDAGKKAKSKSVIK